MQSFGRRAVDDEKSPELPTSSLSGGYRVGMPDVKIMNGNACHSKPHLWHRCVWCLSVCGAAQTAIDVWARKAQAASAPRADSSQAQQRVPRSRLGNHSTAATPRIGSMLGLGECVEACVTCSSASSALVTMASLSPRTCNNTQTRRAGTYYTSREYLGHPPVHVPPPYQSTQSVSLPLQQNPS
jgi:hypothetical protein